MIYVNILANDYEDDHVLIFVGNKFRAFGSLTLLGLFLMLYFCELMVQVNHFKVREFVLIFLMMN